MTRMTIDVVHQSMTAEQRRELITSLVEALVPPDEEIWTGPTWLRIDMARDGDWGDTVATAAGFFDLVYGRTA